jgi:hypothetical protein
VRGRGGGGGGAKKAAEAKLKVEQQKKREEELAAAQSQALVEHVQGILVALSRRREDSFTADHLLQLVNAEAAGGRLTEAPELQTALIMLEAKGRIMYSSGVVYIV